MATPPVGTKVYRYYKNHKPSYVRDPKHVYFRDVRPMKLRDQVTGRDTSTKKTPCVGQLIEMVDCLKRTGFVDGPCKQYITAFTHCNEEFKKSEQVKQDKADEDISLIKSTNDMKREQMNLLLKNFHKKM